MSDRAGEPGERFTLETVGRIASPLTDRAGAPKQGPEGGPDAWLTFEPHVADAARDLAVDDRLVILTWLDRADRTVQRVHPRDDLSAPETGVFSTRSPDRPNPVGLHPVTVRAVDREGGRILVGPIEAIDGTPVVDVKPLLRGDEGTR
ncbi:MAG TPA: tRNA (N6-threonylcarbamoyladenosine(37)-N6)-methyltransferase TrmO [Acidimicrobiales bacterium]